MYKSNALAGLIGSYGESGDESDDGAPGAVPQPPAMDSQTFQHAASAQGFATGASATIHPAPIPHCPWSACYDETSGFTYYWNQVTNAVTWEAPPEYLLALKLAQQHLHAAGSTEVSAEEWQLYQQALAEKQQAKVISKPAAIKKPVLNKPARETDKNTRNNKKRSHSDDEVEKIELITSYHNSDSESDHEPESPIKKPVKALSPPKTKKPSVVTKPVKNVQKKVKTKHMEYGPSLPSSQNYSVPIGPEMPPELRSQNKSLGKPTENGVKHEQAKPKTIEEEEEKHLLKKLMNKAVLLEKLGGELPSGLEKIIREEEKSGVASPALLKDKKNLDIDDLLEEIEKKELPKSKAKRMDMFDEESRSGVASPKNSPRSGIQTPVKSGTNTPIALFPSGNNIGENSTGALFPSVAIVKTNDSEKLVNMPAAKPNVYLSEAIEDRGAKKKFRISNSVLPERKTAEPVSYTTKYSQHIEGFSGERVGLGFSKENDNDDECSNEDLSSKVVSYGKGLMFTKGETLNEQRREEDLEELTELLEAKLKYLNQAQPGTVAPVQEMWIQMQTLVSAARGGGLAPWYWRRWARGAASSLAALERAAAPPGWRAAFQRSEGRYKYVREADGFEQWEYPAVASTDMDICTTPPHAESERSETPPPLPPAVQSAAPRLGTPPPPAWGAEPPPPPPAWGAEPPPPAVWGAVPPPPPAGWRAEPPPPPAWGVDPPPPGCDDLPPMPPEAKKKQEIGDELMSFYNDIAELEKHSDTPPLRSPEPRTSAHERGPNAHERERDKDKDDKERDKPKKKTKVKISTSMGKKHKTVSSMVAKWQQVADEIQSD